MTLLVLTANAFADHGDKAAFGILAELVVMRGLFTDDDAPALVAGIEPLARGGGSAASAVEAHARAHFNKGSALRKFCRLLILHADQCDPLIILQNAHGTYRHFVASVSLADGPPVSGRENDQADHEHGRQHNGGKNDKGFSQL